MTYQFKGDNKALVSSITALLALDAKGALAPHGIGEMARQLLEASSDRLAEQQQDEPVCWVNDQQLLLCRKSPRVVELDNPMTNNLPRNIAGSALQGEYRNTPLFRHADSVEVVALRGAYLRAGEREHELRTELARLRSALSFYADRDHYSTDDGLNWDSCSGEPANILWHESEPWFIEDGSIARAALAISAERGSPGCATCSGEGAVGSILDTAPCPDCAAAPPVEKDERGAFERAFVVQEGVYFSPERKEYRSMNGRTIEETDSIDLNLRLSGWMAHAALTGFKPTVLSRCVLCDQLQADLTALDEKLDQTQDLLRYMVYDYRSVVQAGYDRITALGSDCDSVTKMLEDNPNYQKALALLLPDLESRPEERGTPEAEPCSSCGTPGWTGACNKCAPY